MRVDQFIRLCHIDFGNGESNQLATGRTYWTTYLITESTLTSPQKYTSGSGTKWHKTFKQKTVSNSRNFLQGKKNLIVSFLPLVLARTNFQPLRLEKGKAQRGQKIYYIKSSVPPLLSTFYVLQPSKVNYYLLERNQLAWS